MSWSLNALLLCCIVVGSSCSLLDEYLALTNRTEIRANLKYLTSSAHIAGSHQDYETAEWVLAKFKEFGLEESWIEAHEVLLNSPVSRRVEIVAPADKLFIANLTEPVVPVDPTSINPHLVDTFHGYAPSGNVTAELVYVNYGRYEDFEHLVSIGINVTGKIAIARYGRIFRGTKALLAQEYGCVGILIYSDPADDGYSRGPVYPDGVYRPEFGVQRGSVQFLSKCPGDPRRVDQCMDDPSLGYEGNLIPKIPVQPLSWGDAYPLLQGLAGAVDNAWQGGLNFTYHIGPGPVEVHIEIEMNYTVTPIWNVVARISGSNTLNRTVLVGNHRDAWVFGGADPSSGTAAFIEMARVFGIMLKTGWKPKRDIILASWDGEEYGLLGSTAYGEKYAQELQETTVAYINVDVGVGGQYMGVGATPSIGGIVSDIFKQIPYTPNKWANFTTVFESWDQEVSTLGSGSDYTVFLDHLGIASMDLGFDGLNGGTYHSNYDSFYLLDTLIDPGFYLHEAITRAMGLIVQQIADAEILPHSYPDYSAQLAYYIEKTELFANGTTQLDFSSLNRSLATFKSESTYLNSIKLCFGNESRPENEEVCEGFDADTLNDRLMNVERAFLNPQGLPGRKWFKHVIQAPAIYNGYGADFFPGLTQMIREGNWDQARVQLAEVVTAIENAASSMRPSDSEPKKPNHAGAIAGGVIGGLIVIAGLIAAAYYLRRRNQRTYEVFSPLVQTSIEN